MRKETTSRQEAYNRFERETLIDFTTIKEKIIEEIANVENRLIQLLSSIKEKNVLIPIYNELMGQQQLNPTRLNEIGGKLSELIQEKQNTNNAEEEIFQFKSFSLNSFEEYLKMQPQLDKMKLTLDMIQLKGETEISSNSIESTLHNQQLLQQQMVFSLSSTVGNQDKMQFEGVLWDAGQIIKKYQSPEYEFEFPAVDITKPQSLDTILLNIQKALPKIAQVEQQINLENIQFKPASTLLPGHTATVSSVAISDDQKYIASGGYNNYEIFLWDLQSKENLKKYKGPKYVRHLSFSRDNTKLAVGGSLSSEIFIFDIADLKKNDPIQLLKGHQHGLSRIVFTKNSKNLISGSWDQTLRVWDVDGQKEIANKQCRNYVYGVAISNNEELIGCCCEGGLVYLFESKNLNSLNEKIPPWQAHPSSTNCIEFIQDSSVLLSSGATEIRLWIVEDLLQKKIQHIKEIKSGENNYIWTVKAFPVSNPKVIVGCDGKIKIWKLKDAELKQIIEVQGGLGSYTYGKQFALTSGIKKIITGGQDSNVKIYEKA